jgi:hypothetical protein
MFVCISKHYHTRSTVISVLQVMKSLISFPTLCNLLELSRYQEP